MAIRKESIGAQIKRILKSRKNFDTVTGHLFNRRAELSVKRKKITLIGLFVSDEKTFLLRPHVFESSDGRNAAQWDAYLSDVYGEVLRDRILPGMENRTGKQWRLSSIVGILPGDSTGLVRAKVLPKRNKKKRARR